MPRFTAEAEFFGPGDQTPATQTFEHDLMEAVIQWYLDLDKLGSVYRLTVTDNSVGRFRPQLPRDMRLWTA